MATAKIKITREIEVEVELTYEPASSGDHGSYGEPISPSHTESWDLVYCRDSSGNKYELEKHELEEAIQEVKSKYFD